MSLAIVTITQIKISANRLTTPIMCSPIRHTPIRPTPMRPTDRLSSPTQLGRGERAYIIDKPQLGEIERSDVTRAHGPTDVDLCMCNLNMWQPESSVLISFHTYSLGTARPGHAGPNVHPNLFVYCMWQPSTYICGPSRCSLIYVCLTGVNLTGVYLIGLSLIGVRIISVNLIGAFVGRINVGLVGVSLIGVLCS